MKHPSFPNMTPGRAALIELMNRYLGGLMDPFVTLLEIHKLMYFMQIAGEPLKLIYQKGLYGPFAENLSHLLKRIEGYFISGYADGGDAPNKQLILVPGAIEDAKKLLEQEKETKKRFDRVADLVDGFESPLGLELLSTVHWVVKEEGASSLDEIVEKTHAWNDRKRQFSKRQIRITMDILSQKKMDISSPY